MTNNPATHPLIYKNDKTPNPMDPDFEPAAEQLDVIARSALAQARRRAAPARLTDEAVPAENARVGRQERANAKRPAKSASLAKA